MAYLNLRERRIEAKIAYVGAELVGRSTNLVELVRAIPAAKLGKVEAAEADLVSLSWQPELGLPFRDCSVRVEVVAQKGAPTDQAFDDVMRGADGVVLVIDAHPSAAAQNRAALSALRDALGRDRRDEMPVVVQINKTDLPEALAPSDLVGVLESSAWKHVPAVASRGDGVLETLEAAVAAVIASLHSPADAESATKRPPPDGSATSHPLLAALKDVLRETVREHVAELEARLFERFADSFEGLERRLTTTETLAAKLGSEVGVLAKNTDNNLLAVQLVELLQETDTRIRELDIAVARLATKEDVEAVAGQVERALEARSRTDREHLTTANAAALKKALESASSDVRAGITAGGEATAKRLEELGARIDAVRPAVEHVEMVAKQRAVRVEEAVRAVQSDLAAVAATEAERVGELQAKLAELTEELKKPKKGWFA